MKIGFIGVGNMGKAIITGLLRKGNVLAENILVHSAHPANYETYAKKYGLTPCLNNVEVANQADYLFLAVKPGSAPEILAEISGALQEKKSVVISLLSGVGLTDLENYVDSTQVEFLRIMPNVNVAIGAGITAFKGNTVLTKEHLETAHQLLEDLGSVVELEEKDFSTFVALAGSSPAFVYFYIDSMARAGVKYGLTKKQAVKVAAQAVLGSSANVLQSEKSPQDLVDDVCSPGGTTIAGLLAMEEAGFMKAVVKGIDATIAKDRKQKK